MRWVEQAQVGQSEQASVGLLVPELVFWFARPLDPVVRLFAASVAVVWEVLAEV
jgi:hypothetical protein